ncbi:hypothetical protein LXL04_035604 [Taraxacum kok-saghyz]
MEVEAILLVVEAIYNNTQAEEILVVVGVTCNDMMVEEIWLGVVVTCSHSSAVVAMHTHNDRHYLLGLVWITDILQMQGEGVVDAKTWQLGYKEKIWICCEMHRPLFIVSVPSNCIQEH